MKKYTGIVLCGLFFTTLFLHVWHIDYPATPVFDEAHFATYAANYLKGQPFFDIHPPLGKLMYAAILALSNKPLGNTDFVSIVNSKEGIYRDNHLSFGNYPYVLLRLFGVFWGVLLPFVCFRLFRKLQIGIWPSVLAALGITLDTTLLLETRLILLDGMYLVLGIAGLTLALDKKRPAVWSGAAFGAALGVKLTAGVFLLPLFTVALIEKLSGSLNAFRKSFAVSAIAFVVLFLMMSANALFFKTSARIALWERLGITHTANVNSLGASLFKKLEASLATTLMENVFGSSGYLNDGRRAGGSVHSYASPWYIWPFGLGKMVYYEDFSTVPRKELILAPNFFIWWASALAVIIAIAIMPRNIAVYLKQKIISPKEKSFYVLLAGYFGSLLPFLTIVDRTTFLYHYFPSLLFAIGLGAWWLDCAFDRSGSRGRMLLGAIVMTGVALGFLASAHAVFPSFPHFSLCSPSGLPCHSLLAAAGSSPSSLLSPSGVERFVNIF